MTPQQEVIHAFTATAGLVAQKRAIRYADVDFGRLDASTQRAILESMKRGKTRGGVYADRVLAKNSIVHDIPVGAYITTFFTAPSGSKEVEEKNVKFEPGNMLVKGPLSEVYKVRDADALRRRYARAGGAWVPVKDEKMVVEVTREVLQRVVASRRFKALAGGMFEIPTSYGGTHAVALGDYLVDGGDGGDFYRIKREAFEATYDVVSTPAAGPQRPMSGVSCLFRLVARLKQGLGRS